MFCKELVRAIQMQKTWDDNGIYHLGLLNLEWMGESAKVMSVESHPEEEQPEVWAEAWDDINGKYLEPQRVKAARIEDI